MARKTNALRMDAAIQKKLGETHFAWLERHVREGTGCLYLCGIDVPFWEEKNDRFVYELLNGFSSLRMILGYNNDGGNLFLNNSELRKEIGIEATFLPFPLFQGFLLFDGGVACFDRKRALGGKTYRRGYWNMPRLVEEYRKIFEDLDNPTISYGVFGSLQDRLRQLSS
ncbi:MAG: hypothetical protein H6500_00470 [Candidatus Woesearchaeota archaeon]|nr:MAG: hypothetical protein H6500_00470 [Candidatus Woesearchaeota archaeon]